MKDNPEILFQERCRMAGYVELQWDYANDFRSVSGDDCRTIVYRAYVPDPLRDRVFEFESSLGEEIDQAGRELARLEHEFAGDADRRQLIKRFAVAEATASSKIDDIQITNKRLVDALKARARNTPQDDDNTRLVLANVDAMMHVASEGKRDITIDRLRGFRHNLLLDSKTDATVRDVRTQAKWTGGDQRDPKTAAFVAPPAELVPALMEDLCDFCNLEDMPPVAQAAIAHAQFETIHPFISTNGRTGRGLVFMVLKRRGLISDLMPPLSIVLDARRREYGLALQASRYEGDRRSVLAVRASSGMISLFASACAGAVEEAHFLASFES